MPLLVALIAVFFIIGYVTDHVPPAHIAQEWRAYASNLVAYHYDAIGWVLINEPPAFSGIVPDGSIDHPDGFVKAGPWTTFVMSAGYAITYPDPAAQYIPQPALAGLRHGLMSDFDHDPGAGTIQGSNWVSAVAAMTLIPGFPVTPPTGTPAYLSKIR